MRAKWWAGKRREQRRKRLRLQPATFALGVALVGVPTAFGVFPEMAAWSLWPRSVIGAGWLLMAGLAVRSAMRHERRVEEVVTGRAAMLERRRSATRETVLQSLFQPEQRVGLHDYEWTVYVWDPDACLLIPIFPRPPLDYTDPRIFASGKGATGLAFEGRELVVVTGDAVSSPEHGLNKEQQEAFKRYKIVASHPIWNDVDEVVGALSAIKATDDGYFDTDAGVTMIRHLADTVGTLLSALEDPGEVRST